MKLTSIIPESVFSIIATITGEESLEKAEIFLGANQEVLDLFPRINLQVNYLNGTPRGLINKYIEFYESAFPSQMIVNIHHGNKGHMFGTIDLDEECLAHAKVHKIRYLWKSTDDMIVNTNLLDKDFILKDFYYLPGFSYESLTKAGVYGDFSRDYERFFYTPQSNFFIVNTERLNSLYGPGIGTKHQIYLEAKKVNPNVKPWELKYLDGIKFDCESMLGNQTKGLTKQPLIGYDTFQDLISLISMNRIGDPSHKNILFKESGLCHYHHYKESVYEL